MCCSIVKCPEFYSKLCLCNELVKVNNMNRSHLLEMGKETTLSGMAELFSQNYNFALIGRTKAPATTLTFATLKFVQ